MFNLGTASSSKNNQHRKQPKYPSSSLPTPIPPPPPPPPVSNPIIGASTFVPPQVHLFASESSHIQPEFSFQTDPSWKLSNGQGSTSLFTSGPSSGAGAVSYSGSFSFYGSFSSEVGSGSGGPPINPYGSPPPPGNLYAGPLINPYGGPPAPINTYGCGPSTTSIPLNPFIPSFYPSESDIALSSSLNSIPRSGGQMSNLSGEAALAANVASKNEARNQEPQQAPVFAIGKAPVTKATSPPMIPPVQGFRPMSTSIPKTPNVPLFSASVPHPSIVPLFSGPFPLPPAAAAAAAAAATASFALGSDTTKSPKNAGSRPKRKAPIAAQNVTTETFASVTQSLPTNSFPPFSSSSSSSSSAFPSNLASVGEKKLHSPEVSATEGIKKLHFPDTKPILLKSPIKTEKDIIFEARQAFAAKEFAVAHKRFSDALLLNPKDVKCLSNRAACSIMLLRHDEAVEDCQHATIIDPSYAAAYQRCARAFLHLGEVFAAHQQAIKAESAALVSGDEKDINAGKKLLTDTKIMVDADATALLQIKSLEPHKWALVLSNSDHLAKSIVEYAFSISTASIKARALLKMKKPVEAAEICAVALPIQLEGKNEIISCRKVPTPTSACCAVVFAMCVWACEDVLRALRILSAVNRSCGASIYESSGASALYLRITTFENFRTSGTDSYKRGEYAEALTLYKKALAAASGKFFRSSDSPFNNSPWPEQPMSSLEFSREWGCSAPEISFSCFTACANICANLSAASMALHEFNGALEYAQKATIECPNHIKSVLRRARVYMQLFKFTEAIKDFQFVISYLRMSEETVHAESKYRPLGGQIERSELPSIVLECQEVTKSKKEYTKRKKEAKKQQKQREEEYAKRQEQRNRRAQEEEEDEDEEDEEEEEEDYETRRGGYSSYQRQQYQQRSSARTIPPRPTDYYSILGVSPRASAEDIKSAFRKAALLAHPDKGGSKERFQALNEAHAVVSNSQERANHDNEVKEWIKAYGRR